MIKRFFPSGLLLLTLLTAATGCKHSSGQNEETDSMEANQTLILDSSAVAVDSAEVEVKENNPVSLKHPSRYIVVDKPKLKLYVVEQGDTLFKGPISCGRNFGQKQFKDDRRTPEGTFHITNIHDASGWLYEGRIPHVYGPWFLRLSADGWRGIGIHGTSAPGQISRRVSKGCIRMLNQDIVQVKALAEEGMKVIVVADNKQSYVAAPGAKKESSPKEVEIKESQTILPEGEVLETQESIQTEAPVEKPQEIKEIKEAEKPQPVKKDTIS